MIGQEYIRRLKALGVDFSKPSMMCPKCRKLFNIPTKKRPFRMRCPYCWMFIEFTDKGEHGDD